MFKNSVNLKSQLMILFCALISASPLSASAKSASPLSVSAYDSIIVETSEVQLLHVTTDAFDGFADIKLVLDIDRNIIAARQIKGSGERTDMGIEQLLNGVVLFHQQGYDTVKVVSKDMKPDQGGTLDLIYLADAMANGMKGSYKTFRIQLVREGSVWKVFVDDQGGRREIQGMFMKAKKFMGKVVGIQKVIVN